MGADRTGADRDGLTGRDAAGAGARVLRVGADERARGVSREALIESGILIPARRVGADLDEDEGETR